MAEDRAALGAGVAALVACALVPTLLADLAVDGRCMAVKLVREVPVASKRCPLPAGLFLMLREPLFLLLSPPSSPQTARAKKS